MSRRQVLKAGGMTAATALAGCSNLPGTGSGGKSYEDLSNPYLGDEQGDVVVEVWEDYSCSHCRAFNLKVLPRLYQEYIKDGSIKYVHHDYPLPMNRWSWDVAYVARKVQASAGREAFWVFVRNAYEYQSDYSVGTLKSIADKMTKTESSIVEPAIQNQAYRKTIETDKQKGENNGVEGTPWVTVNGEQVPRDFRSISAQIESLKQR
ncbi:thioredoxin domain-containing protein [Salinibaculum rarum]|uniref:thioredoxin domain-containing protein n=1 Tax=Salinibaculum rarum TaxID=3058903 RepID=UPI00265F8951|nr:thioredoxin domain-containing protein [Salinibaculum sp. KK48]